MSDIVDFLRLVFVLTIANMLGRWIANTAREVVSQLRGKHRRNCPNCTFRVQSNVEEIANRVLAAHRCDRLTNV